MRQAVGRYRLERTLGEGGMGVVYAARDERLDRSVAIKMIRGAADAEARARLWREARAAASVNHPNVCQLYEVGEEDGELFIAMEMLEGEPLGARLQNGPLELPEAVQHTLGILAALQALGQRGFMHRDLKPSNVFLTPHGVKLLDFGLARPLSEESVTVTLAGATVGTPRYMAPEQWRGEPVDTCTDLFAVGALLFEMLTGRPAFEGGNLPEIFNAVHNTRPPALTGSPAIEAVDRAIHRALEKRREDRYPSADAMAKDLRVALTLSDLKEGQLAPVRTLRRLIVLPLRVLRPDPDTDFLAFSLADAITTSLSGFDSLVVRSSIAASRYANASPDLKAIAAEADVDVVLSGTLLRAGDQVRVSVQLAEAPAGTLQWSKTTQVALGDLFQLQDSLAHEIVESLALPLKAGDSQRLRDIPASPRAYELYLRANQLSTDSKNLRVTRELYQACIEEDPRFAPAWARLGRSHRMIAKFAFEDWTQNLARAETAFRRSLELNPDLSIAHNLYAQLEVDLGRAPEAMVRLLQRAANHRAEPELFAGLVHACRYCGLLESSVAAYERAARLDPTVRTSVAWSYWAMGDYEKAIETDLEEYNFMRALVYVSMGREKEGIELLRTIEEREILALRHFETGTRAAAEGVREGVIVAANALIKSGFRDAEGLYTIARMCARVDDAERALGVLDRVVDEGYFCTHLLASDPWLDSLRTTPRFVQVVQRAETRRRAAADAYEKAGGEAVLGVGPR